MHIKGFLKLIRKYRDETLPKEKKEVMDRWYDALGQESGEPEEKDQLSERMWDGILSRADQDKPGLSEAYPERRQWWKSAVTRVAALSLLLLAVGVVYYSGHKDVHDYQVTDLPGIAEWVHVDNTSGSNKEVLLADGSRVVLEPGSVLRYPSEFSSESRTVRMEGNVFFDVAKDQGRPFFVHAGDVSVRVLGTSFTIREMGESSAATEVAVITGKVVVEKAQNTREGKTTAVVENKIVLTPNKKVTFFKDSDHYITGLVDNPVLIGESEEYMGPEAFDFDDMPLSQILEKLEKAYGVSIAVSDESTLDCRITADLSSDNLYGKIEVISAILNASYEITGNTILLLGGVCNVLEK